MYVMPERMVRILGCVAIQRNDHDATLLSGRRVRRVSWRCVGSLARRPPSIVEVFGVGVAGVDLLGVPPIDVVHLNHGKIPVVLVVVVNEVVEGLDIAVVRETEVADSARLALFEEKVEYAVVDVTFVEAFHAVELLAVHKGGHADAVQVQVVDVVGLQFFKRVFVHAHRSFVCPLLWAEC